MGNRTGTKKINHRPGWKSDIMKERQKVTDARQNERNKRSPADQLKLLDQRLGVGVGAVRERARLQLMIDGGKK